jgi:hypothetical protein
VASVQDIELEAAHTPDTAPAAEMTGRSRFPGWLHVAALPDTPADREYRTADNSNWDRYSESDLHKTDYSGKASDWAVDSCLLRDF